MFAKFQCSNKGSIVCRSIPSVYFQNCGPIFIFELFVWIDEYCAPSVQAQRSGHRVTHLTAAIFSDWTNKNKSFFSTFGCIFMKLSKMDLDPTSCDQPNIFRKLWLIFCEIHSFKTHLVRYCAFTALLMIVMMTFYDEWTLASCCTPNLMDNNKPLIISHESDNSSNWLEVLLRGLAKFIRCTEEQFMVNYDPFEPIKFQWNWNLTV